VERLLEYSKFKKYSELLMGKETSDNLIVSRRESEFQLPFSDDELWEDVTAQDLLDTFLDMMKSEEKVFNVYESVTEKEKIALMNELFETRDQIKFSELFPQRSAMHIICSFLAVLESVKDKMILVDQPELFGDMTLTKRPADWNPNLADEYDEEYDEMTENDLSDEDDFSVVDEDGEAEGDSDE